MKLSPNLFAAALSVLLMPAAAFSTEWRLSCPDGTMTDQNGFTWYTPAEIHGSGQDPFFGSPNIRMTFYLYPAVPSEPTVLPSSILDFWGATNDGRHISLFRDTAMEQPLASFSIHSNPGQGGRASVVFETADGRWALSCFTR